MENNDIRRENEELFEEYLASGHSDSFEFENGNLVDTETGDHFEPEEIYIREEHKLKLEGKPSAQTILFVFETNKSTKGLFVIDEKASQNPGLREFFKAVPEDPAF